MPRLLVDLAPLRASRAYRWMWAGTSLSAVGTHLTTVAVGLQVYDLTGSSLSVGLVGLFALVPLLLLGLYGGALVDAYDRRRVVLVTAVGLVVVALCFVGQAAAELSDVRVLYALVAVQNGLFAVSSPARTAVIPRLLTPQLLPAANALASLSFGVSATVGPLAAGALVAAGGYVGAYAVEAVLLVVALVSLAALPPMPPEGEVRRAGLGSVLEGLRFLRTRPNVRMTFLVDLSAMVLAMPRVLFPAIAATRLGGGAGTVGVLVAAIAVGAILSGLLSGPLGAVHRQGRAVVVSVVGWGLAVVAFGVVVASAPAGEAHAGALVWLAAGCMVLAGAADTISSVFRQTILQAATPDVLRGRLQGIFVVVVAGGPRLGDLLLGWTAELTTEWLAAVAGGTACVVVVTCLALTQRRFLDYDARSPEP
ncbi:MFS transporter [Actinotalea ferrariae]|uniref:MFS transporter n=1 Tax=Actinotalea ferrariae TaxID=1386098 RepID=UPI001C8C108A|nr:MFS transporter [Actinotalea ferrariae]MBX9245075.1 MFS transporter [Actinotalea ferrariae]